MNAKFSVDDSCKLFDQQLSLAWDHFKFHAEQRTKMFHFFLITSGLIVSAFSYLVRASDYKADAFIALCVGGVVSTVFLSLDVRNTQLLEHSEDILCEIERDVLYQGMVLGKGDQQIQLGLFSRDKVLKEHVKKNNYCLSNNIKHKSSIRFMQFFAIISFWFGAIVTVGDKAVGSVPIYCLLYVTSFASLWWSWIAMQSPARDEARECKAYAEIEALKSKL